ncbi:hypothetical protein [Gillisia sp. JM1]|uniref:hypothetical protein n=1 Tax=Gillisia sp. JM1 TaxID=1283286 RepID=UPI000401EF97|nr:hypothetical protein [Gillisia sp. JM1]
MKTIIVTLTLILFSFVMQEMQAQNDSISTSNKDSLIIKKEFFEKQKQKIIDEEKEGLKLDLEEIANRLNKNIIAIDQANVLKENAAKKRALNIENRIIILENRIALEERNGEDVNYLGFFEEDKRIDLNFGNDKSQTFDKRTSSGLVLAVGLNNAISKDQSLNNSDFKVAGSRFFELGWAWKTRVFDDSNWLRLKYGVSLQFNGLKPTEDRIINIDEGGLLEFVDSNSGLEKSKFKMNNLVFPLHFEFGPSKKIEKSDYFRYSTNRKFKIGLGGYAGVALSRSQKLKYSEQNTAQLDRGDFNTNNFVYGLSSYISLGSVALYAKYDLNPIFKDPNIELRNISFGLRFDID